MIFVASGAHMPSRTGEEMLYQNRIHQCLNKVKENPKIYQKDRAKAHEHCVAPLKGVKIQNVFQANKQVKHKPRYVLYT